MSAGFAEGKTMAWLKTKQTNSSMYSPYTEATVKWRRKFFSRLPLLWAFSLLQWDLHIMKCSLWSLASSRRCSRLPLQAELFPSSLEMGHPASFLSAALLWPPKAKSHSLFHLSSSRRRVCAVPKVLAALSCLLATFSHCSGREVRVWHV